MDERKLRKETYYANGTRFINLDIEGEILKHIKNIKICVERVGQDVWVLASYNYANCKINLDLNFLYLYYEHYLEDIANEIVYYISKEYFRKGEE